MDDKDFNAVTTEGGQNLTHAAKFRKSKTECHYMKATISSDARKSINSLQRIKKASSKFNDFEGDKSKTITGSRNPIARKSQRASGRKVFSADSPLITNAEVKETLSNFAIQNRENSNEDMTNKAKAIVMKNSMQNVRNILSGNTSDAPDAIGDVISRSKSERIALNRNFERHFEKNKRQHSMRRSGLKIPKVIKNVKQPEDDSITLPNSTTHMGKNNGNEDGTEISVTSEFSEIETGTFVVHRVRDESKYESTSAAKKHFRHESYLNSTESPTNTQSKEKEEANVTTDKSAKEGVKHKRTKRKPVAIEENFEDEASVAEILFGIHLLPETKSPSYKDLNQIVQKEDSSTVNVFHSGEELLNESKHVEEVFDTFVLCTSISEILTGGASTSNLSMPITENISGELCLPFGNCNKSSLFSGDNIPFGENNTSGDNIASEEFHNFEDNEENVTGSEISLTAQPNFTTLRNNTSLERCASLMNSDPVTPVLQPANLSVKPSRKVAVSPQTAACKDLKRTSLPQVDALKDSKKPMIKLKKLGNAIAEIRQPPVPLVRSSGKEEVSPRPNKRGILKFTSLPRVATLKDTKKPITKLERVDNAIAVTQKPRNPLVKSPQAEKRNNLKLTSLPRVAELKDSKKSVTPLKRIGNAETQHPPSCSVSPSEGADGSPQAGKSKNIKLTLLPRVATLKDSKKPVTQLERDSGKAEVSHQASKRKKLRQTLLPRVATLHDAKTPDSTPKTKRNNLALNQTPVSPTKTGKNPVSTVKSPATSSRYSKNVPKSPSEANDVVPKTPSRIATPTKKKKVAKKSKKKKRRVAMPFVSISKGSSGKVSIFKSQFYLFAKFGDRRNSGETISMANTVRWLKQADIIDNRRVTSNDVEIYFIYTTQRRRSLRLLEFISFLKTLCGEKRLNISAVMDCLMECGEPVISVTDVTIENVLIAEATEPNIASAFAVPLVSSCNNTVVHLPYKSSTLPPQITKYRVVKVNEATEHETMFPIPSTSFKVQDEEMVEYQRTCSVVRKSTKTKPAHEEMRERDPREKLLPASFHAGETHEIPLNDQCKNFILKVSTPRKKHKSSKTTETRNQNVVTSPEAPKAIVDMQKYKLNPHIESPLFLKSKGDCTDSIRKATSMFRTFPPNSAAMTNFVVESESEDEHCSCGGPHSFDKHKHQNVPAPQKSVAGDHMTLVAKDSAIKRDSSTSRKKIRRTRKKSKIQTLIEDIDVSQAESSD